MFKSLRLQSTKLTGMDNVSDWLYRVAKFCTIAMDKNILSLPPLLTISERLVVPIQTEAITPEFVELVSDELNEDWDGNDIELILRATPNRQIRRVFSYSNIKTTTVPIREWRTPDWDEPRVVRYDDMEYLRVRGTGDVKLNAFLYAFVALLPFNDDVEIYPEGVVEGDDDIVLGKELVQAEKQLQNDSFRLSMDDQQKLSLRATLMHELLSGLPTDAVRHICLDGASSSREIDVLSHYLGVCPLSDWPTAITDRKHLAERLANMVKANDFLGRDVQAIVAKAIEDALAQQSSRKNPH